MRTRIKVADLSIRQWELLKTELLDEYDMAPHVVRVCVVFEFTPMVERHVEMPVRAFTGLMTRLQRAEIQAETAAAIAVDPAPVLQPGWPTHVRREPVRQDCAFCHLERSAKDDNHAPECPYWTVGPGSLRA
jgi:hypothetical protein